MSSSFDNFRDYVSENWDKVYPEELKYSRHSFAPHGEPPIDGLKAELRAQDFALLHLYHEWSGNNDMN